jgi:hypothetical protein
MSMSPARAVMFLVDDQLAVDVDRDGRTDLLAAGDSFGERVGDLLEPGITMALQDTTL